ncbi:NADP-dependent malic enzyme [Candidatus Gracilibacteria bacterium]|nr:NADP-dependent malic enzyme [Candidatus Gracilibacteria bacterium]
MIDDLKAQSLAAHKKYGGKLEVHSKVPLDSLEDLSIYYSPGVAAPCMEIAADRERVFDYTMKRNTVAVVTDGSAVLGLGNIGPEAALPVMEGKCVLFKQFAGVDAFPICLDTQDTEEIIRTVKLLAPVFGGINLEDIAAPRCFEIEERLKAELDIPVFHDDQYGTAIVTLAGLINALKVVGKSKEEVRVVISGAGAAGMAIAKLLLKYGFGNLILADSEGLIYRGRDGMNGAKEEIATVTNLGHVKGSLSDGLVGADIFIGVSMANIVSEEMVRAMAKEPIIFAMANPDPEIKPELALAAGAAVVATGRSDYPNQINNVLVFPGIFRGALDARVKNFTWEIKIAAAEAIAALVKDVRADRVIPGAFEEGVCSAVAEQVKS